MFLILTVFCAECVGVGETEEGDRMVVVVVNLFLCYGKGGVIKTLLRSCHHLDAPPPSYSTLHT